MGDAEAGALHDDARLSFLAPRMTEPLLSSSSSMSSSSSSSLVQLGVSSMSMSGESGEARRWFRSNASIEGDGVDRAQTPLLRQTDDEEDAPPPTAAADAEALDDGRDE